MTFEPGRNYQGPAPISAGRLEIRTLPTTPNGNTLVTVVDDSRGIVLEEHVYDPQGNLLATALLSRHQRDGTTGITLPRHVALHLPTMQMQIGIDLKDLQINRLQSSQADLWVKPSPPGYPEIDLADPNLQFGTADRARCYPRRLRRSECDIEAGSGYDGRFESSSL